MSAKKPKRIGILTAGGDSPGLNAAIRGVGKTAIGHYGMELIGFRDGITGLVQNRTVAAGPGGAVRDPDGRRHDPGHQPRQGAPDDGRRRGPRHDRERSWRTTSGLGLDGVIVIGGGGTAKNAMRLQEAGLPVLTLPKTIDNDIWGTDTSFGFATATEIATEAIDRVHSTAHSHHRIILTEVMGHRAGWLTLASGTGRRRRRDPDPGDPLHGREHRRDDQAAAPHGSTFSVVAVAEGARDVDDTADYQAAELLAKKAKTPEAEAGSARRIWPMSRTPSASTRSRLARELEAATGLESRVTILGYVQRGGTPCAADRLLGTRLGAAAADLVARGECGLHGRGPRGGHRGGAAGRGRRQGEAGAAGPRVDHRGPPGGHRSG